MPRTVITGGAGFLGSHLCDRFLADGHTVVCVDNFLTGSPNNLAHLHDNPRFELVRHDVTEFIDIPGAVDYVLHFASPASPIDYLRLPIQTLKVGALGTHNALGLTKVKKACFLLASTSEVYGDPLEHPQKENYWGNVNPVGLRGVYDEAKRFAEAITMAYHRYHGIDTRIARIFNSFGPRMRMYDGRALPNFMRQALREEPLTVYGSGKQSRSFTYVDDTVEGIVRLLYSEVTDPVNIGSSDEVSVLDFAREILAVTGSSSPVSFAPLPADDPKSRQPDTTLANRALGWKAGVSRREGLRRTLDYVKSRLASEGP